jgi:hypothetical protein
MGTGSFLGAKRKGRGTDHAPPSSTEFTHEKSYTSTPDCAYNGMLGMTFTFTSVIKAEMSTEALLQNGTLKA